MEENANEQYGAFRVGSQDDLVTALGLVLGVNYFCGVLPH